MAWGWWPVLHMSCVLITRAEFFFFFNITLYEVSFSEFLLSENSSSVRLLPSGLVSFILKYVPLSYPNCFHIHFHADNQGITGQYLSKALICIIMCE